MDNAKSWLTSKTIWVSILGFLVQATKMLNVHIPGLDGVDTDVFAGHLADLASAIFFIAAAVFRATATKTLTAKPAA